MDTSSTSLPTPLRFPPIPLVSGDSIRPSEHPVRIEEVIVTVRLEDGTQRHYPLENRFGGWWVPADMLNG